MNGGSFIVAPETLETAAKGLPNVDTVTRTPSWTRAQ
jgi:hypothetical protein